MKIYSYINNYLLTHFPIIWHSKTVLMTSLALLTNCFFYILGYFWVSIPLLKEKIIQKAFWGIPAVLYSMIGLILLAIWGLMYFRNLAAKKFYPISKFYFHHLFLLLFIPAFIFCMGKWSFDMGIRLKTKHLVPKSAYDEFKEISNLAYPFLVCKTSNYSYENRVFDTFYKSLKFENIENLRNDLNYESDRYYLEQNGQLVPLSYQTLKGKPSFFINGYETIAFNSKIVVKYTTKDSCEKIYTVITKFYSLEELKDLKINNVKNYATLFIEEDFDLAYKSTNSLSNSKYNYEEKTEMYDLNTFGNIVYEMKYAPRIHHWIEKSPDSVEIIINHLKKILNRYKISNSLEPSYTSKLHKYYQFEIERGCYTQEDKIFRNKVDSDMDHSPNATAAVEAVAMPDKTTTDIDYLLKFEEVAGAPRKAKNGTFQHVDTEEWQSILHNLKVVYDEKYPHRNYFYFIHFIAMVFAALVIIFEFASIQKVILTIPISGTIGLGAGILVAILSSIFNEKKLAIIIYFLVALAIHLFTLWSLKNIKIPKKVLDISFIISYVLMPFFLFHISYILIEVFSKSSIDLCGNLIINQPIPEPITMFLISFGHYICYFLYLFLIKKYLAREE